MNCAAVDDDAKRIHRRVACCARRTAPTARSGYILMELLAALALTSLMMLVGFPTFSGYTGQPQFYALTSTVVALLRDARSDAALQGSEAAAVFDRRGRSMTSRTRQVSIPRDVDASVVAGGRCDAGEERIRILFEADGRNCGAVIRLALGSRVTRIRVNWLTGYVEVLQGDG